MLHSYLGYDTHEMPTEKKAIEKLGLDRSKIPVTEFRDTCKKFTSDYKNIQTDGFKRLGVLGDWDHPYVTYEHATEAAQLRVFSEMYLKGYIYRGLKPVYWCTDCETALAEAEIEYKDVTSPSIYVSIPSSISLAVNLISPPSARMRMHSRTGMVVLAGTALITILIFFSSSLFEQMIFIPQRVLSKQ